MSKKLRTLALLTLTSVTILSLLGCQTAPSTAGANPSGEKSITIVIGEDPPSFNPMVADTGYDALVMEMVLLGVTDIDAHGNVFPELAAELPCLALILMKRLLFQKFQ